MEFHRGLPPLPAAIWSLLLRVSFQIQSMCSPPKWQVPVVMTRLEARSESYECRFLVGWYLLGHLLRVPAASCVGPIQLQADPQAIPGTHTPGLSFSVLRLSSTVWSPPWKTSSTYSLSISSSCSSLLSSRFSFSRASSSTARTVPRTQRRSACKCCRHAPLTSAQACFDKVHSSLYS